MKKFSLTSSTRLLLLVLFTAALAACTGITPDSADGETTPTAEATAVAPLPETPTTESTAVAPLPETPTVESTAVASPSESTAGLDCEILPETVSGGEQGVIVPADAVVVVTKEGGIAGIGETWTVYADGLIVKDSGEQWQAPVDVVNNLVMLADEAGFYDLAANYVPQDNCCDQFVYSVTVRDCEQVHTVTAVDNAPEVPSAIWDVVHILEDMLSSNTTTGMTAPGDGRAS